MVTIEEYNLLIKVLVGKIVNDTKFSPDSIIALSTGGFPVAASLAKRLGIQSQNVAGLPIMGGRPGKYSLAVNFVKTVDCSGREVLVVDEASYSGILIRNAVQNVIELGGIARSCVLVASMGGLQPDYVADFCIGKPPKFYWEST